jgi:hypothetical protein
LECTFGKPSLFHDPHFDKQALCPNLHSWPEILFQLTRTDCHCVFHCVMCLIFRFNNVHWLVILITQHWNGKLVFTSSWCN